MAFRNLASAVLVVLSVGAPAGPAAQVLNKPIADLVKAGKVDEAWKAWEALPKSADTLRTGIALAAETKRIPRGIEIYDALVAMTKAPDPKMLTLLAQATAGELAASPDIDAQLTACGAALLLDAKHAACRTALDTMAQKGASVDEQMLALYTLANAGIRPWPERIGRIDPAMSKQTRLRLALQMSKLPDTERLALVRSLLDDPDVATRYQTILVLTEIPGPNTLGALRNLESGTLDMPLRMMLPLALARLGDARSLEDVRKNFANYQGPDKMTASRALAAAGDARGIVGLQQLAISRVDVERLDAASALAPYDSATAKRITGGALTSGSPAMRPRALQVAGSLKMGLEPEVYRTLADTSPLVRACTVDAIARTVKP